MSAYKNISQLNQTRDNPVWMDIVLKVLPSSISNILCNIEPFICKNIEEIRLRTSKPLMITYQGKSYIVNSRGQICERNPYIVDYLNIQKAVQIMTQNSIYAVQEEIKNGYLTLKGGYRVGIAGTTVVNEGEVVTIKNISGLNIRIAREIIGVADKIIDYILDDRKRPMHTLIISPPRCGKTTLLRDIVRQMSNTGMNIGVVDERSEIAGTYMGKMQFELGIRTDVLDCCPKDKGIIMMIRSMSPDVIVTDEIGKKEDIAAIEEALVAGIKLITTVHGMDIEDVKSRPVLSQVINKKIFQRIIILGNTLGVGTVEDIFDGMTFKKINRKPLR
ncbi:MAG: stage III sporulation protein AA [Clostridia bacterium]|nr:stage III sporulation protein AA [Clostridia bacterium]